MGRSFVTSVALVALAGCWDQPQLQLDVHRDDPSINVIVWVCEPGNSPCDHNEAFPVDDSANERPVSIFTKSPSILLWLQDQQSYCIDLTLDSNELHCEVLAHSSSLDWIATTSACNSPSSTCPAGGPGS